MPATRATTPATPAGCGTSCVACSAAPCPKRRPCPTCLARRRPPIRSSPIHPCPKTSRRSRSSPSGCCLAMDRAARSPEPPTRCWRVTGRRRSPRNTAPPGGVAGWPSSTAPTRTRRSSAATGARSLPPRSSTSPTSGAVRSHPQATPARAGTSSRRATPALRAMSATRSSTTISPPACATCSERSAARRVMRRSSTPSPTT